MRFVLLAALAAVSSGASAAQKQTKIVEVDGAHYRVTTNDDIVVVAKKSVWVQFSMKERDAMRRAAEIATGCSVYDEFPNGARLKGKLKCQQN